MYRSSRTLSTQEQALDQIMNLTLQPDGYLHDLLVTTALRPIATLRDNPERWCSLNVSLQYKTQKALATVTDVKICHLFQSFYASYTSNIKIYFALLEELREYLLYVPWKLFKCDRTDAS